MAIAEVKQAVRAAEYGSLGEIGAVVLGTDGTLSVIGATELGDGWTLSDVNAPA